MTEPWWAIDAEETAARLAGDSRVGLSGAEAARRLVESGSNELAAAPRTSPLRMLAEQFAHTMIVVLLVAAAITVVVGELRDTIVIAVIVVLDAVIGFTQEYRAERAMAALRRLTAASAHVVRDGRERIVPAGEIVAGDTIVVEAGDVVPADARLVHAPGLRVDESALTGESAPVAKRVDALPAGLGDLVADRVNTVFKGTAVVHGRATAIVVATGMATALGEVAGLLQAHAPPTPLQRRLAVLGRRLAVAALIICAVVFVAGIARGEDVPLMLLAAVSLAVAAIPEALPAVVTVALALGAQRMARHHALVRKLPAVETLGSVTVICTDKTGTLTQGRMQVERLWTPAGEVLVTGSGNEPTGAFLSDGQAVDPHHHPGLGELLLVGALCNDAELRAPQTPGDEWRFDGDPTEAALLVVARKAGLDRRELEATLPRIGETPFDATRRRMTTLHAVDDGHVLVAVKGALEAVLPSVSPAAVSATGRSASPQPQFQTARTAAERYTRDGYRVLALASARHEGGAEDLADSETGLALRGLVAIADAARPESHAAVAACRAAGVVPVMITGDHPATARAIAQRVGLLDESRRVMTGRELAEIDTTDLVADVAEIAVYARTTPEQKLTVVDAWTARGDVVAMTGDGVNDAPALRRADIGVAMGITGTEVSKEAADMVLADDNFATIVTAIGEGRRIYDNIRRFIRYTLTSNSGEIWVMLLGPFVGLTLPLLPAQILWINLVTDGLPGLALGIEPAERDTMRRPPRSPRESVFSRGLWQHVAAVGLLMGLVPLMLGLWGHATGRPWQTMVFASLALLQLGHALAVRSERQALTAMGVFGNKPLLAAVLGTAAVQIGLLYWAPTQALLRVEPLAFVDLLVVLAASTIVLWAVELEKLLRRRVNPAVENDATVVGPSAR